MNDNENSHKRTSEELDLDIKLESNDSNNHHNLDVDDLQSDELPVDATEPPAKKVRTSEELDIRFLVSSKEAGAIIGKGGANINHLRKNYKSSVTVPDCPGPERVLSIVASIDTLGDILRDVIGYIDDRQHNTSGDRDVELRLLIHTSHAGGIIGKGGQRIRDLRDQTKAAIKVFSQCCPLSTERICAVQGSPDVVINAIKIVLDIILSSPIKGPVKLYDPFNFDVYGALEYGGYTEPAPTNFRGTPRPPNMPFAGRGGARMPRMERRPGWQPDPPPIPPPPDAWVSRMPYNGPADRRGPPHQMYSNRWLPSGDNPRPVPPVAQTPQTGTDAPYWSDVIPNDTITQNSGIHSSNSWTSAYSAGDSNFNSTEVDQASNMVENSDGSATATINVPNNVAGAIIGKGGNRIRLVRRDSGADITIDSSVGVGKERVITVKGNSHQVRTACSMIHKSIAENTRRY